MIDLDRHIPYQDYYLARIGKAKKTGNQLTGLCPFHEDRSESFSVDIATGKWTCFAGCGAGNVVSFHAKQNAIGTKEAFQDLCAIYGVEAGNKRQDSSLPPGTSKTAKTIPLKTLDFFRVIPSEVLDYLQQKRGWSLEVIQKYQIGYNARLRFDPGNIGEERITIPIFDEFGELVNIRSYQPGAAERKVVSWSTGSKKKGTFESFGEGRLWPLSVLGEARSEGQIVYLAGGEPDCLCGLSQGLRCITGTIGEDNWKDEWNHLFKGLHVRIPYDNDDAGRKGMARVCEHLPGFAEKVECIRWPEWMGEKEDLTDWFMKYGKTKAEFEALPWVEAQKTAEAEKPGPQFSREELLARIEGTSDFDELTVAIAKDVALSGLSESATLNLQKMIAKKAGVSVGALKADAKAFKAVFADCQRRHLEAAKEVIKLYGAENILMAASTCWCWNGCGVWKTLEDREIKQKIHGVAGSDQLTKGTVESILDLTKTEIFMSHHQFDLNQRCINVMNGELHFIDRKWEIRPHCRENYSTTQLPVAFDVTKKAPRFLKYLDEVFRDDSDREEKKQIVIEGLGYSLLTSCEFEKFFLLIGPGANGKSVLMDTLGALVGKEHVSAVQPSQFDNRFQRAHLHGKLVNLVTEIAEGYEIPDAQLKAIVSGELTTAEHKMKPPFDFRPFSTCWFGTNHMPHTRDFSDAMFRRAIILTFNRTFSEGEQDKHLKGTLKEELSGILNLALSGMLRLVSKGQFTQAESVEKAKKEWRLECDQVAQFVGECCELGTGDTFKSASGEMYKQYEDWAKEGGIKKMVNRNNFTRRLEKLGVQAYKGTRGERFLAGIRRKY